MSNFDDFLDFSLYSLVLVIKMEIHDKFNIILLPIFLPFKVRITYPNKNAKISIFDDF